MNQRKPNRKTWYSLGLTVLLCIALLVIATGTTLARYRAEREKKIGYKVQAPDQIHLGTVSVVIEKIEPEEKDDTTELTAAVEVFTPQSQLAWTTDDGITQLELAVANGVSELDFSARDQRVRLRMIGTLGVWAGTQTPNLYLILPPEDDSGDESVIKATVSPFIEGSSLQLAYGDGWLYTFLDEEGEELFWDLPGGGLSFASMTITVEGDIPENLNLLQPQVTAEIIPE